MSNVSSAHTVTLFDAKKSQALTGQRLAKCRYKSGSKYPSVCISVPFVYEGDLAPVFERLLPYVLEMVQTAQDGIIRSLYESSGGNLGQVLDSDISMESVLGYLEAESTGGRLTKEFIESWFDSNVRDYVQELIAEKLGFSGDERTGEQEIVIGKHVAGYKGLYSSLAGGKTVIQENTCKSLVKVLELIDSDSTSEKLLARLVGMMNKPKLEELLEL
jgi:hypothetical protein